MGLFNKILGKASSLNLNNLARKLLSQNIEERDAAINLTRQLAREGKRDGLIALEEAIRYMHGGKDIEFYRLGGLVSGAKDGTLLTS